MIHQNSIFVLRYTSLGNTEKFSQTLEHALDFKLASSTDTA